MRHSIDVAQNRASGQPHLLSLSPALANRHGCITGATGTGKTVTLQVMAQAFSDCGVPVFMADVKGDLSGLAKAGAPSDKTTARLAERGLPTPQWQAAPVTFWDVFGEKGHPVRATVSDLGPLLLARMLDLNEIQQSVLQLVFKIADDHGLLLLDGKDLRAMLQHVGDNAADFKTEYGNISAASIGAIQRGVIAIGQQGGDHFFGEPMLDIDHWLRTDAAGRGMINILSADRLLNAPRLYATFLLWMLSEVYEHLPEVGDVALPKLVFFFDEAHLLFDEAPRALLQKIEQVVRLIRSKGAGVYFVTQNPLDIPDTVLGQLGNRVQHALRAYTPRDQKAVQAAATTFRPNPQLDTAQAITALGVGEALISLLDEKGVPGMVERAFVLMPASQIGAIAPDERAAIIAGSSLAGVYETTADRVSAYEKLKGRVENSPVPATTASSPSAARHGGLASDDWGNSAGGAPASGPAAGSPARPGSTAPAPAGPAAGGALGDTLRDVWTEASGAIFGSGGAAGSRGRGDTVVQAMVKSAARSIGSQAGRALIRGVLGSMLRKK